MFARSSLTVLSPFATISTSYERLISPSSALNKLKSSMNALWALRMRIQLTRERRANLWIYALLWSMSYARRMPWKNASCMSRILPRIDMTPSFTDFSAFSSFMIKGSSTPSNNVNFYIEPSSTSSILSVYIIRFKRRRTITIAVDP